MIEYIKGKLNFKDSESAIIDCGGVGYYISISYNTYQDLPDVGDTSKLLIHLIHREDTMELYGFSSEFERQLFRKLINVSRIGPKLAIAILSGSSPDRLSSAIELGDVKTISKIPRVGKKTAERIVMELRGKLDIPTERLSILDDDYLKAVEALVSLGYSRTEAAEAVNSAKELSPDATVDELIKISLKK